MEGLQSALRILSFFPTLVHSQQTGDMKFSEKDIVPSYNQMIYTSSPSKSLNDALQVLQSQSGSAETISLSSVAENSALAERILNIQTAGGSSSADYSLDSSLNGASMHSVGSNFDVSSHNAADNLFQSFAAGTQINCGSDISSLAHFAQLGVGGTASSIRSSGLGDGSVKVPGEGNRSGESSRESSGHGDRVASDHSGGTSEVLTDSHKAMHIVEQMRANEEQIRMLSMMNEKLLGDLRALGMSLPDSPNSSSHGYDSLHGSAHGHYLNQQPNAFGGGYRHNQRPVHPLQPNHPHQHMLQQQRLAQPIMRGYEAGAGGLRAGSIVGGSGGSGGGYQPSVLGNGAAGGPRGAQARAYGHHQLPPAPPYQQHVLSAGLSVPGHDQMHNSAPSAPAPLRFFHSPDGSR
jgi:hypothetical protein